MRALHLIGTRLAASQPLPGPEGQRGCRLPLLPHGSAAAQRLRAAQSRAARGARSAEPRAVPAAGGDRRGAPPGGSARLCALAARGGGCALPWAAAVRLGAPRSARRCPRRTPARREGRGAATRSVRASKRKELRRVPGSRGAFGTVAPRGTRAAVRRRPVVRSFLGLASV